MRGEFVAIVDDGHLWPAVPGSFRFDLRDFGRDEVGLDQPTDWRGR
jgi:hypothetical protein